MRILPFVPSFLRSLFVRSFAESKKEAASEREPEKKDVARLKLLASVVTAPARNTDIPLKVTGSYSNPTVRPDIEGLAKDQLKQKLQDVLKKNGLQGLFSK